MHIYSYNTSILPDPARESSFILVKIQSTFFKNYHPSPTILHLPPNLPSPKPPYDISGVEALVT